ncbi:MAG: MFS transporter [Candidatus Gracilibacteria bacterium]|jgi:predicted MFS family arabinose efflux permease|nr:MFS transporter [Candidatus Gracilibacteria bacterium]
MPRTKHINKIIKTLIFSDFFLFFGIGLLTPIFALFIMENIENKIEIVGYATTIYWLTRLVATIPVSRIMDKIKGHRDEYYFLVFGTFFVAFVPLLLLMAKDPLHLYLIQVFNGVAMSMAVQSWRILFTTFIDKPMMGFEWSVEDVGISISTAISASLGAFIVKLFGFPVLLASMFLLELVGTLFLVFLYRSKKIFTKPAPSLSDVDKAPLKIDSIK